MTEGAARLQARAREALAGLPALLLSAERLAAMLGPGAHGQRRPGTGEDFWQYRPAAPGDTLRSIDWRRSARSDGQFVRDREAQSAQSAVLWVSAAAGMEQVWPGPSGPAGGPLRATKGDRARLVALALALALLAGGERVAPAGEPARAGRAQGERIAAALLARLEAATARPADEDAPPLAALRPGQRVVLLDDFLGDPAPVLAFLGRAAGLGVRGAMVQVLDPEDELFPFAGAVDFRLPGGGAGQVTRDAAGLRAGYLARLADRRALLGRAAAGAGWHFVTHRSDDPPAAALIGLWSVLGR